jgi:hypothetical protein
MSDVIKKTPEQRRGSILNVLFLLLIVLTAVLIVYYIFGITYAGLGLIAALFGRAAV